jgi:CubicO group peptidase (beta-lactamase class C family)
MNAFDRARAVVERGISDRTFPAAAVEVGSTAGVAWQQAFGTLTFDPGSPPTALGTPFDLASLTKVLATTTIAMELVGSGRLRLDERVAEVFDEWRDPHRESVVVRDLLEHASGLPPRLFDAPPDTRREFEHEISRIRLEYAPRTKSVYSDLDFILLGFLLENRTRETLSTLFTSEVRWIGSADRDRTLTFGLAGPERLAAAPTVPLADDLRRGRVLVGEVHDNYAAALGGVAGHAGLFGSAPAVGAFARAVLHAACGDRNQPPPFSPDLVSLFTKKSTVPGSSRALGWDTMLPTSSCGTKMSAAAFGQVGYTGTSLWIDPERDRYVVLLTNRAYGVGSTADIQSVRRAFHDALGDP